MKIKGSTLAILGILVIGGWYLYTYGLPTPTGAGVTPTQQPYTGTQTGCILPSAPSLL